jgi:hypothetical protein
MIDIPEGFDINLFKLLNYAYDSEITRGPNEIGASETPHCPRKIVLKKIHGIEVEGNAKMLIGTIFHSALQQPKALQPLIQVINERFGITGFTHIVPEKEKRLEIAKGKFLEIHADIATNHYLIEIKTTQVYVREWIKEIASRYFVQANTCLGVLGLELGFVACLNLRAFQNTFNGWNELWEKYGYFIPFRFDQAVFDETIQKLKLIFKHIDAKDPNIECHPEDWECNLCEVSDLCGKTNIRCGHVNETGKQKGKQCTKEMKVWHETLTPEFLEHPICQHCYETKTRKRKPYDEFKQKMEYPWSEN